MTKPCVIRLRKQESDVSPSHRTSYEPTQLAGDSANIDALLLCLELNAQPIPIAQWGVRFEAIDNWGHFRQNTFLKVSVTIAADGAVEINEDIGTEDGSYY